MKKSAVAFIVLFAVLTLSACDKESEYTGSKDVTVIDFNDGSDVSTTTDTEAQSSEQSESEDTSIATSDENYDKLYPLT